MVSKSLSTSVIRRHVLLCGAYTDVRFQVFSDFHCGFQFSLPFWVKPSTSARKGDKAGRRPPDVQRGSHLLRVAQGGRPEPAVGQCQTARADGLWTSRLQRSPGCVFPGAECRCSWQRGDQSRGSIARAPRAAETGTSRAAAERLMKPAADRVINYAFLIVGETGETPWLKEAAGTCAIPSGVIGRTVASSCASSEGISHRRNEPTDTRSVT